MCTDTKRNMFIEPIKDEAYCSNHYEKKGKKSGPKIIALGFNICIYCMIDPIFPIRRAMNGESGRERAGVKEKENAQNTKCPHKHTHKIFHFPKNRIKRSAKNTHTDRPEKS